MSRRGCARVGLLAVALLAGPSCSRPPGAEPIKIGLLLSYSGPQAANSVNAERAVLMAIDAGNAAGGVQGRPIQLVARDTGTSFVAARASAQELVDANVAVFLGPDSPDLVSQVRTVLEAGGVARTVLLPSFATASDVGFRVNSWFVMGPSSARVACELVAQLDAGNRRHPVVVVNPNNGYNSALTWELVRRYGMPKVTLPADQPIDPETVADLLAAPDAQGNRVPLYDAYVLAALPPSAAELVFALNAAHVVLDPQQWYLSPTLHTRALLDTVPRQALAGARGVSVQAARNTADFEARFSAVWNDRPFDDAYSFYDAGMIAVLALQRALLAGQPLTADGLASHIRAVTAAGNQPVHWNAIARGLRRLEDGQEIEYQGLTGNIRFDEFGQTPCHSTSWWTIDGQNFSPVDDTHSTCPERCVPAP